MVGILKLTDVDISQCREALAELSNLLLVGLGLVAVLVLGRSLLLKVEPQILQQHNAAALSLVHDGLDLGADTVGSEGHGLAQQLLELGNHRLQTVLGVGASVGPAKVGHEHHGLGAVVDSILDGGDRTGDTLVVGDLLVGVKGNVEVDLVYEHLC